jgi:regulator of protease activity HflC (stomatin/prohibitin superfamily)
MLGWIISGVVALFMLTGIRIVRPIEKGVVETLGKYTRLAEPGFNYIVPIIQRMVIVNTTERMTEIDSQEMITEDKLNATVDLVVYYKVGKDENSIKNSLYEVNNFRDQIVILAQTTARNVIGGMLFKDVNSERNKLNNNLAEIMRKETKGWGVQIIRVELKEIIPPQNVQNTMNSVLMAENAKRAAIDTATATETQADGVKRAKIKEAEGSRQAMILEAQGKSEAFDLVNKAFKGNAKDLKQLEVLQASLQNNSKIIITEKGISPQLIIGNIPMSKGD